MLPDWVHSEADRCYRALAAAQLAVDDDNVTKWLAMNAPVFQYYDDDDLDRKIAAFVEEVKKIETGAKEIAAAAEGAQTE